MTSTLGNLKPKFKWFFKLKFKQKVFLLNGHQDLEAVVTKRMEKDGMKGMAIVGGATLAFGALVGLGIAMAKKN